MTNEDELEWPRSRDPFEELEKIGLLHEATILHSVDSVEKVTRNPEMSVVDRIRNREEAVKIAIAAHITKAIEEIHRPGSNTELAETIALLGTLK